MTFPANLIFERKGDRMEKTKRAEEASTKAGRAEELQRAEKQEGTGGGKKQGNPAVSMPHDKGYKKSLSRPSEFLHFLKKYVKADWMMDLMEADLILCDKEMLERDYEGKEADLLYRVNMPDGREVFIFILQELQSYVDPTMIFRILVYVVNTLVKYFLDKGKNEREHVDFRLNKPIRNSLEYSYTRRLHSDGRVEILPEYEVFSAPPVGERRLFHVYGEKAVSRNNQ